LKNIYLIISFVITFFPACGKKEHCFDKAINKLTGKSWVAIKKCVNDSCYSVDNKYYYSFSKSHMNGISKGLDTASLQFKSYEIGKDGKEVSNDVFNSFLLFFCDASLKNENTFPIVITFGDFRLTGEVSFISESEFVLNINGPKSLKNYFKLAKAP